MRMWKALILFVLLGALAASVPSYAWTTYGGSLYPRAYYGFEAPYYGYYNPPFRPYYRPYYRPYAYPYTRNYRPYYRYYDPYYYRYSYPYVYPYYSSPGFSFYFH